MFQLNLNISKFLVTQYARMLASLLNNIIIDDLKSNLMYFCIRFFIDLISAS